MSFQPRIYNLAPFAELRVITEDDYGDNMTTQIRLMKPANPNTSKPYERCTAEIFGRELVPEQEITLGSNERLAIYTWTGCTLQIKGPVRQEYEAYDHSMKEYLNIANALDAERELATIKKTFGPRVLVTGAPSSGKSSICMILCNYALRNGWTPVYVETDPRCSTDKRPLQFFPGTIGATVIGDIDDVSPKNPIAFYYGYGDVLENERMYIHTCKCLSAAVDMMMEMNLKQQPMNRGPNLIDMGKHIAASGTIINAPFQVSRDLTLKLAEIFNVSMVVVVDSPSIHQDLVKLFTNNISKSQTITNGGQNKDAILQAEINNLAFQQQQCDYKAAESESGNQEQSSEDENAPKDVVVLGVTKLEGVVPVDQDRLKYLHHIAWKQYFERSSLGEFHVIRFRFDLVELLTIHSTLALTGDALPKDEQLSLKTEELYAVKWLGDPYSLVNLVLAIPSTETLTLVPYSNVLGFFHIRNVQETEIQVDNGEETEESIVNTSIILEVACHTRYSATSLPKHLIVPGNTKFTKWSEQTRI